MLPIFPPFPLPPMGSQLIPLQHALSPIPFPPFRLCNISYSLEFNSSYFPCDWLFSPVFCIFHSPAPPLFYYAIMLTSKTSGPTVTVTVSASFASLALTG